MQNYPTLKTTIPYLQLQPLQKKHVPFLVELLSEKEIQKTLYRVPTKITAEKEFKAITRMYEGEKPKEITYILTIKKLFTEKFIGYVKIKLIDWSVKSCYLSVAIMPNAEYRGKGYAKASYDSFFEYLFSLGFMKIYGRTYESNTSTIKLNKSTGFEFIGRQHDFILYPDNTSLDALLFERVNPNLQIKFQKPYALQMNHVAGILLPLTKARQTNTTTPDLIEKTVHDIDSAATSLLPIPIQRYLKEITTVLRDESTSKSNDTVLQHKTARSSLISSMRAENASAIGFSILSYPVTQVQLQYENQLDRYLIELINSNIEFNTLSFDIEKAFWYGGFTPENWGYLEPLFLGLKMINTPLNAITSAKTVLQRVKAE